MALKAVAAPLGSPVGGTGTTNTIPRWTGASTLGDSGLIDDGSAVYTTTRKLAVGSASAVSELTAVTGAVAPTANPPALQTLHGNNQNVFRAKYTSTNFNVSGNWLGLGLGYHDNYMKAAIIAEAKDGTGRASMHIALNAATTAANVGLADARLTVTYDGNVGIGTTSPSAKLEIPSTASLAGIRVQLTAAPKNNYYNAEVHNFRSLSDLTRVAIDTVNNYIDASLASGWGLKLPATPGNADTQTLDCYQENTWTPTLSAAATWGGTQPTVTSARYTRIGRMVFCEVKLDLVAGFSVTYGSTTITGPFNAGAETAVPVSYGATGQIGAQASGSTTVYLPTVASTQLARITWSFSI